MSSVGWGDEGGAEAPRKKRVPNWVWWGCGGGCLFMVLIGVALVVLGTRFFKESTDPEKQWPRLAEVLAFDQRPAGLELHFGSGIGADLFVLVDPGRGLMATVIEYPASASHDQIMDPDFELPTGFGPLGRLGERESGKLVVQGREVPCLRFASVQSEPEGQAGPGIRVDLTGTRKKPRTLELRRQGNTSRIEDGEVEAFLVPFDVWREP